MLRRTQVSTLVGAAIAVSVALVLASCAAFKRGAKAPPPPTPTPVTAAKAAVYYSAVEGLKVYSEPSTRSKAVGTLSLHEKVTRTRLEQGYAYVESAKGRVKGWVVNAQLIWRLPTTAAPAPGEAQPEEAVAPAGEEPEAPAAPEAAPAAAEPLPEPTPVRAEPPRPKATPGGVAPSIFNPY